MKRILLVNPWIADTAAYNFWLRPLGLYALASWIDERGGEPVFLDTLSETPAPGKFKRQVMPPPNSIFSQLRKRFALYGMERERFISIIKEKGPYHAVLMTSGMSYWYPGVQEAIKIIKSYHPLTPVILGGVYATLWPEHATRHSGADYVLKGTLKANSQLLAGLIKLPKQPIKKGRTWYELGLHDGKDYTAIRTARGCPFNCTYCASGLLSDGFKQGKVEEIFRELEFLYGVGVRQAAFYDDALLVNFRSHLLPLLKKIRTAGMEYKFHTPNAMHANLLDSECADSLMESGFRTVRISLETVDRDRQRKTGGKVRNKDVENAVKRLHNAGFGPEDIGIYLLAGLPDQTYEEILTGITFIKSIGARPYLAEFSPIPGTVEWKRLETMGIVSNDMDPILTNNSLFLSLYNKKTGQGISEGKMHTLKKSCLLTTG